MVACWAVNYAMCNFISWLELFVIVALLRHGGGQLDADGRRLRFVPRVCRNFYVRQSLFLLRSSVVEIVAIFLAVGAFFFFFKCFGGLDSN